MRYDFASPDYAAVRHILDSPTIAARTAAHIGDDDFDWEALLVEQEKMSGGERVLVLLAYDLWEAKGVMGIGDLARRLDRHHFERVIDAIRISRGELPVQTATPLRDAA